MNPYPRHLKNVKAHWRTINGGRVNGNRQGRRNDNRAHKRDMRARGIR